MTEDMHSATPASGSLTRAYARYLKLEKNYSPNTVAAYLTDIGHLVTFSHERGVSIDRIELSDLQQFVCTLRDMGIGPASQARMISGLRSFYRFMLVDGRMDNDPTELLESPQTGERLPEVLTPEEVDRMKASIDLSTAEGQRNRAIIEVLFSCGLRVSELVNMKLSAIYAEERFVRIMGKGSKERLVPISDTALHELGLWYADRCHLRIKPGEESLAARQPPDPHHGVLHHTPSSTRGRHPQAHFAPHAAPQFCHSAAQGRGRPESHPGHAGA